MLLWWRAGRERLVGNKLKIKVQGKIRKGKIAGKNGVKCLKIAYFWVINTYVHWWKMDVRGGGNGNCKKLTLYPGDDRNLQCIYKQG